ncbi:MAG TPA: sulfur transferase domain-containing protein [Nostocaceae cyanobacterium]|nr:sulfur transferase domain-containing protein [Nostocaceae cyanobacterium]
MDIRKINQELAITGQITAEQLQQIALEGYKSVLNLCLSTETYFWNYEQERTELLGLKYVNLPTKIEEVNHQNSLRIFKTISDLPKPTLIHCDNSMRAAAIVLLYIATKQGIAFDTAWQQTVKLGLHPLETT